MLKINVLHGVSTVPMHLFCNTNSFSVTHNLIQSLLAMQRKPPAVSRFYSTAFVLRYGYRLHNQSVKMNML